MRSITNRGGALGDTLDDTLELGEGDRDTDGLTLEDGDGDNDGDKDTEADGLLETDGLTDGETLEELPADACFSVITIAITALVTSPDPSKNSFGSSAPALDSERVAIMASLPAVLSERSV